jgi:hypothetical protein
MGPGKSRVRGRRLMNAFADLERELAGPDGDMRYSPLCL